MSGISDIYWNLNSNLPRPSAPCSGQFSLVNHYAGDGHDLHMMPAVNMHQTALSALLRPNRAWTISNGNPENSLGYWQAAGGASSTSVITAPYQGVTATSTSSTNFSRPSLPLEMNSSPRIPSSSVFNLNGTKYYRCDCGYETARKGDMTRHHQSIKHRGQMHICSLCEKRYTRRSNLVKHQKRHFQTRAGLI